MQTEKKKKKEEKPDLVLLDRLYIFNWQLHHLY